MKLKPILCAFLSLFMLLSYSGIALAEENKDAFKPISSLSLKSDAYRAADFKNDTLLAVAADKGKSEVSFKIYLVDVQSGEIIDSAVFSASNLGLAEVNGCKINEDNTFTLFDYKNGKTAVFSGELAYLNGGTCEKTPTDYNVLGKDNTFISSKFTKNQSYAYYNAEYSFSKKLNVLALYNDNSSLYMVENTDIGSILSLSEKRSINAVKTSANSYNATVFDYEKGSALNVLLPSQGGYESKGAVFGKLGEKYAFVVAEYDKNGSAFFTPFIWDTSLTTKSTFSSKKYTQAELNKINSSYITEIKNKYSINIRLNEIPKTYPTYKDKKTGKVTGGVTNGAHIFDTYVVLRDLSAYLSYFPKRFTYEMANYGGRTRSFDIYIDKAIQGTSNAYASSFNGFFLCFATEGYSPDLIPHELMHLIDSRVDYYNTGAGKDYESIWNKLNPSGFKYKKGLALNEDYFVSSYAMTDSDEDRAETFSSLFNSYGKTSNPFAKNGVKKKAIYLTEAIRSAFPSVKKEKMTTWEHWVIPYPSSVKFKYASNYVQPKWSGCRNAESYELQQKINDEWKTVYTGSKKKFTVSNLTDGTLYYFRVRSIRSEGAKKVKSTWVKINTATAPAKPKLTKLKTNKKHRITAKWKKLKRCDGYQLQYCRNKSFNKSVTKKSLSKSKKSYTGKGFKKRKKYYVRIRAYKLVGDKKVYSEWSNVKKIKCK